MPNTLEPPTLAQIQAARARIAGSAIRTPLVRLNVEGTQAEIWLKLENLQPIGSFKIRGAANAMGSLSRDALAAGVYTASAGNMAQGVAWNARRLGVPCTVVVPENAPQMKIAAIERLGATIIRLPFDAWWQVLVQHGHPGVAGVFIHPVSDPAVMAGNGTIGLEIIEDLPDVDAVVVPYGGGGLSSGIAVAVRGLAPHAKIFASEVETAAPFSVSLADGRARDVQYVSSFVDGIGAKGVLREMWPIASKLLDGSLVVSVAQVAAAVNLLVERNHIVAEGAGAVSVAAALAGNAGSGKIACVVSGGNLDTHKLAKILAGEVP